MARRYDEAQAHPGPFCVAAAVPKAAPLVRISKLLNLNQVLQSWTRNTLFVEVHGIVR